MYYRRLPLTGLHNARDLGGYPTPTGATRFGVFLRAEAPCALTDADIRALREYGITTTIDFRGDREVRERPSSLVDADGIAYLRSPTYNDQVAFGAKPTDKGPAVTSFVRWGEKYVEMADTCKAWVAQTIDMLTDADGGVLFNCTTGKDRTGIMSALILGAVGVSFEDIIADYCISEVHLQHVYKPLIEGYNTMFPEYNATVTDPFFRTEPSSMAQLLLHLKERYGGVPEYLLDVGVKPETIERLRDKLVLDERGL
jgi:protein-tyrosine phosphatase